MYAVRDQIRSAGINFDAASCEIMDDGKPPARCGKWFAAVHGGTDRSTDDNNLMEYYDFSVTLTMRVTIPLDRAGDQLIHRNIARLPIGEREGLRAKIDQLRRILNMNWKMTCLFGQTPPSANDNLSNWLTGTVYGFVEPARFRGTAAAKLVGGGWFEQSGGL